MMTLLPNERKTAKYQPFSLFVGIMCAATNISQMSVLIETGITRYVAMPVWVLLATVCVMRGAVLRARNAFWVLGLGLAFAMFYLLSMAIGNNPGGSALPYPIMLSLFVFTVGLLAGRELQAEDMKRVCDWYAVSAVVVAVEVFSQYVVTSDLTNVVYAYGSKNSTSQILLTALVIFFLFWARDKSKGKRLFGWGAIVLLTATLLGIKSRATIIALPFLLIWMILGSNVPKRVKRVAIIFITASAIVLMVGDNFDSFVNNIIFANRDGANLNALSSGRVDQWARFPDEFMEAPLFGHGKMERESLILVALLEYGAIGGSIIFLLAASPMIWGWRYLDRKHELFLLLMFLAFSYLLNGVFEQLAPFGPGVKCYFLWFLFGVLAASPETVKNSTNE